MKLKNGAELTLRKAVREDAADILAYLAAIGGESDNLLFGAEGLPITAESEASFIESMNAMPTSALFVGLTDGEIACVGSVAASAKARIAHHGELAISVRKKYWGIGVGSALMDRLEAFAVSAGLRLIHLGVKADNANAIALYRKKGFGDMGRFPDFFNIGGTYYDELLMVKRI